MKNLTELDIKEINKIAQSWSVKKGIHYKNYKPILRKVKNGIIDVEELPFFVCRYLHDLGYKTPLTKK